MSALPDDPTSDWIVPLHSLPNPNAHRNRAPAKSELLGLQTFVNTNSRIIGILDEEIEKLRGTYNALQARYMRQQMELEATLSELHKASDLLVAVQKQRTALKAEQDDLHALMHPIRRCPDEVLKEVFELTVVGLWSISARMRQAVRCSSVCQRWRAIAVDAPRLWTNLSLYLQSSSKDQVFLRDHIIPRVKQVASDVAVAQIARETLPALEVCGIRDIPVINTLRLKLEMPNDAQLLMHPAFNPPVGAIRTLSIATTGFDAENETQQEAEKVNTLRILTRFPPLSTLKIGGFPNLFFPPDLMNVDIVNLELNYMGEIDITRVLKCFPRLQSFKIEESKLVADRIRDVLPAFSVKEIQLHYTEGKKWMERVAFPLLGSLTYYGEPTDALLSFLSAHQSLKKFISNLEGNIIPTLAEKLPQLLELQICPPVEGICRALDGNSELPFPSLKSLTISCVGLTLEGFEALVRARCLPIRHPKSQAKQHSDIIGVFALAVETFEPLTFPTDWKQSELHKESAKEGVVHDPYTMAYLSWPEWE